MRTFFTTPAALTLCVAISACTSGLDDELNSEERSGPYPPPPAEHTADGFGMLRVANELTFDELDDDVPLDVRAANSITEYRAGADELVGTADDLYIATVADLDGLYWLGSAMMWRILNYAVLEDFVPAAVPPRKLRGGARRVH